MEDNNLFESQTNDQHAQSNDYNPNQVYNYERAHTKPERGANNHPIPPTRKKPNNLAVISLAASLSSIFLCCCNPYAAILCSVMSIALAICSKFFNNEEKRMYPHAVAAIIISTLTLILILGSIVITYVIVPHLYETSPEFKEYYDTIYKLLIEAVENTETTIK